MTLFTPKSEAEAAQLVADLALTKRPVTIQGGATRAGVGRPNQTEATISTTRLTGITLHEPAELVISARAGTPVAEVEAALAAKGQMLPFEPMDHRGCSAPRASRPSAAWWRATIRGPAASWPAPAAIR